MVDSASLLVQASETCSPSAPHWRVAASLALRISKARLCGSVRQGCVVEMGAIRSGLAVAVFEEPSNPSQADTAVILPIQCAERD